MAQVLPNWRTARGVLIDPRIKRRRIAQGHLRDAIQNRLNALVFWLLGGKRKGKGKKTKKSKQCWGKRKVSASALLRKKEKVHKRFNELGARLLGNR
jgi:hypothetical protein